MSESTGFRTALTVMRDIASFVLGWMLIFSQAGIIFDRPPHPSEFLIIIGALVAGVPGIAQLIQLRFGGPSASPLPPPPSASSSGRSSGVDQDATP